MLKPNPNMLIKPGTTLPTLKPSQEPLSMSVPSAKLTGEIIVKAEHGTVIKQTRLKTQDSGLNTGLNMVVPAGAH